MKKMVIAAFIMAIAAFSASASGGSEQEAAAPTRNPANQGPPPPIDIAAPPSVETATFGLGWFWGPDARFGQIPGVIRTRVGYAGGTTSNPTYRSIGDHAETIQVDYNPEILSYSDLLEVFWEAHNPAYGGAYGQYRSLILYHNEEQQRLAEKSKTEREKAAGSVFTTAIASLEGFTLAELYHQKYSLQADKLLMAEFMNNYSDAEDIIDSTAAARINGYIAGYGSPEALKLEIDSYGLSDEAKQYLLKLAGR